MPNGSPPSSRPYLALDPSLVAARGTLRDALGGLGNLDQLLRSLRVGPKALSSVLPDVLDSCAPARAAVSQLLEAAGERIGDQRVIEELEHYFAPRLRELEQSIARATKTVMNARHRLELERVVTRVTPELEAARALLDLLEEALAAPSIRLKLRELLNEISMPEHGDTDATVRAVLEGRIDDVELSVQPQVAMNLLTLGINLVAQEHPEATPHVKVQSHSSGACTIAFEPGSDEGERLLVGSQTIITPTLVCLDEAVTHMGCSVQRLPGEAAFSVTWS